MSEYGHQTCNSALNHGGMIVDDILCCCVKHRILGVQEQQVFGGAN
jgi:hypothetical protein